MKKITVLVMLILGMFASSLNLNASSTGDIVGPNVIHKQSNHILTVNDILSMYSSTLGQVFAVEDAYTGNGNILGIHPILLKASDGTLEALKPIEVYVVPTLGNVQAVTDYKNIHLRIDQALTPQEIVMVLEKTGYLEITATTQMMLLTDTYSANATEEGQYLFEFRLINSAGLDQVYSSQIFVSQSNNLFIPDIIFEAPPSMFAVAWQWIQFLIIAGVILFIGYKFKKAYDSKFKKRGDYS